MKKSLCIALIVIFASLLGVLLLLQGRQEDKQTAHMQQLQEEARPYEQELSQIRLELRHREKEIALTPDTASAIIGFVPTSADDIAAVKEFTEEYELTPLIILDCAMEQDILQEIAQTAVQQGCDLVLAGITFDADVLEKADAMKTLLPAYGYDSEPAFFLRLSCDTEENRDALRQHGYQKFVRFQDSFTSGVDETGVPYVAFGFIRSANAYPTFINQVADAHSYTVMVIDFADIQSGAIQTTDVTDFLEAVEKRAAAGEMQYADLPTAFQAVAEKDDLLKQREDAYRQYETRQQKRIEELEEIISAIYSRWDEYEGS